MQGVGLAAQNALPAPSKDNDVAGIIQFFDQFFGTFKIIGIIQAAMFAINDFLNQGTGVAVHQANNSGLRRLFKGFNLGFRQVQFFGDLGGQFFADLFLA